MSKYDSCLYLHSDNGIDWGDTFGKMKSGSHMVAICPVLEHHRITQRVEDAGFEIRDSVLFLGRPRLIVTLARVPLEGTVAWNILKWGTGALNVDGCRVSGKPWKAHSATGLGSVKFFTEGDTPVIYKVPHNSGRWPANVLIHDDESIKENFPKTNKQAICKSDDKSGWQTDYVGGKVSNAVPRKLYLDDENGGSASRYFYNITGENKLQGLVAYLHKLITPPGGTTLFIPDPFPQ